MAGPRVYRGEAVAGAVASYAAAEQEMLEAVARLDEYLRAGARVDEPKMLGRLERGARHLDRHLGLRGRFARSVRAETRRFRKGSQGADLYAYLQAVARLSFAADRVRRKPREAAKAASQLAVSLSIHLASAANRTDLVRRFESGGADFAQFSAKLADALEERGVLRAAEFHRAANQAFDVGALWDGRAAIETKRVLAAASVASSAFACVLFVDSLRALGRYREAPYGRLVPIVAAILRRLGGHP